MQHNYPEQQAHRSARNTAFLPQSHFLQSHIPWIPKEIDPRTSSTLTFLVPYYPPSHSGASVLHVWYHFSSCSDPSCSPQKTVILGFHTQRAENPYLALSFSVHCKCLRKIFWDLLATHCHWRSPLKHHLSVCLFKAGCQIRTFKLLLHHFY